MTARAIVLSDLHLAVAGAGGFDEDRALVGMLERLRAEGDTELVLAGDIFDLLLDPSYDDFSRTLAVPRLQRIFDNHHEVIMALGAFARATGNSLTLLSGNHDPELALPEVRKWIGAMLGVPRIGEEHELVPGSGSSPPVFGCAVGPTEAPVWIVHGDRWDLDNHVDRSRLLATGTLELPLGSRLVIEVLRELRAQGHEWVYWLKPELSAVVPLLLYLDPVRTWTCVGKHLGLSRRLLVNQIRTLTRATGLFGPAEGTTPAARQPSWIVDLAESLDPAAAESLLAGFQRALELGHPPTPKEGLTGHGGVRKWLVRAWLAGVRRSDRFSELDGPDPIHPRAQRIVPPEVHALVVGHTHGARTLEGSSYVNTGTWLPIVGVPEGPLEQVIDAIERGELRGEAPRSYAEITLGAKPIVALRRCDASGRPTEEQR